MYEIHFRRQHWNSKDYSMIGVAWDKEQANKIRKLTGDLVVDPITKKIVVEDWWLSDWEKKNPNCYAQRAIRWQKEEK